MSKNLVIVESPAKAKTIAKYLGADFMVKSSFGHIRDLPSKGISVDIEHNFKPTYAIPDEKTKVVNDLKKSAKGKEVWLASDEDREGEAIAWHLCSALGLDEKKTKRIVFHEITKGAIEEAVKNPRTIDIKRVDAQQARRILDRLVGYELSPILWKKIQTGLSAGRVQSVAVRLIVEREREIAAFDADAFFKTTGEFIANKHTLNAELDKKFSKQSDVETFMHDLKKATYTISSIEQKPSMRNPSAPFTTSTLQQEAARLLGYSVRQTMRIAQNLYEEGHITYMRTDSTNLAQTALQAIHAYITDTYGNEYLNAKTYATKAKGAQEAHEAIRPTDVRTTKISDSKAQKLYDLIWRRTVASQMAPAKTEKTEAKITISTRPEQFVAKGEILQFEGFYKAYKSSQKDLILPEISEGQKLTANIIEAIQSYTKAPARYSEAALVRKLEELGIGRPSTYAPTISTIQDRGYIEKNDVEPKTRDIVKITLKNSNITQETTAENYGADKNKLLPTPVADVTTDFLIKYFASILDYNFTAKVEDDFDNIADGKIKWQKMLETFYKEFHPLISKAEQASRSEASQARTIGKDPKTKKPVIARFGRYGPMLQIGEAEDEEKPQFAPLPKGTTIQDVTLEQALKMFTLPRTVGKTKDGKEITANIGRFGPYIKVDSVFYSIKDQDPLIIKEKEALEIIAAKEKQEAERIIATFGKVQILNGPYGPYITDGKKNARVPKETDPKKITEKQALKLLAEAPAKAFRKRRPKK